MMDNISVINRQEVQVQSAGQNLPGLLALPQDAAGIVLFAHGSGSGRFSVRNQYVAGVLNQARIGTLLFDLLSPQEERLDMVDGRFRFDIDLLAQRVRGATDWLAAQQFARGPAVGYFGASTGAAAALVAAAGRSGIAAIVSRGGRPDLAGPALGDVTSPTLLIVGGHDRQVIALNQLAMKQMKAPCRLEIVPGATHLFEEPGTLEQAAALARDWFARHFVR